MVTQVVQFPSPSQPPPLIDDPTVREVFADEVAGITVTNGNINLTFAAVRADHSKNPATHHRMVTARLVIPIPTGVSLEAMLSQVFKDLQAKGFMKMGPPLPMGNSPDRPI
jgi:hypothetical protein